MRAQADLKLIDDAQGRLNNGWLAKYCDKYLIDRREGIHLDGNPMFVHVEGFQGDRSVVFEGYPHDLWTLPPTPSQLDRSIGEFIAIWNQLSVPYYAEIPSEFEREVYVRGKKDKDGQDGGYQGQYSATNSFGNADVIKLPNDGFLLRKYHLRRDVKDRLGLSTYDIDWAYYIESDDVAVEIPVKTYEVPIIGIQSALLKNKRRQIEGKPFADAFPELNRYAAMLRERKIEEVDTYLNGLVDVSEDSLEVFGVGIRSGNIRRFGPLVLLVVQVYLLLHFRHLRQRFESILRDIDVPWIGLYPDLMSRIAFIVTVVLVPPAVAFVLLSSQGLDMYIVCLGGLTIAVAVASGWTWGRVHQLNIGFPRWSIRRPTNRSTGAAADSESEGQGR